MHVCLGGKAVVEVIDVNNEINSKIVSKRKNLGMKSFAQTAPKIRAASRAVKKFVNVIMDKSLTPEQ